MNYIEGNILSEELSEVTNGMY